MTRITDDAVEAVCIGLYGGWRHYSELHKEDCRTHIRSALEAALPHLEGATPSRYRLAWLSARRRATLAAFGYSSEGATQAPTREQLAKVMDPDAFDETKPKSKRNAAVLQWAARRHMAFVSADRLLAAGVFREGATPAIDREALRYLLSYHYYDAKWSKEHQGFRCVCGWLGDDHVRHVVDLIAGAS